MFQKIGIMIFVLGVIAVESASILAPLSLIAVGMVLYLIGERLEA